MEIHKKFLKIISSAEEENEKWSANVCSNTSGEEEEELRLSGEVIVEAPSGRQRPLVRDDAWLAERVSLLWEMHFADVPIVYPIHASFGTRARYRFGSIMARNATSIITINRLFADPFVPVFVVDGTIVHELAHYVHGYGSGLPRLYDDPHRGGVVEKELEKRGLGELNEKAAEWREANWDAFYAIRCHDLTSRRTNREEESLDRWNAFISRPGSRTEAELRARLEILAVRLGIAPEEPLPFTIEWLRASRRQSGLSYWFGRSRVVRLHGLLADRRVPAVVVDFELAYWLAGRTIGENWKCIHAALRNAGLETVAEDALRWRRHAWTAFRNRNHPLAASPAKSRSDSLLAAAHKTDRMSG